MRTVCRSVQYVVCTASIGVCTCICVLNMYVSYETVPKGIYVFRCVCVCVCELRSVCVVLNHGDLTHCCIVSHVRTHSQDANMEDDYSLYRPESRTCSRFSASSPCESGLASFSSNGPTHDGRESPFKLDLRYILLTTFFFLNQFYTHYEVENSMKLIFFDQNYVCTQAWIFNFLSFMKQSHPEMSCFELVSYMGNTTSFREICHYIRIINRHKNHLINTEISIA
jgi:hypothetical protein